MPVYELAMELRQLVGLWHAFFFTPENPVVISVFRIAFGVLLLVDALYTAGEVQLLYGPHGVLPFCDYQRSLSRGSFSLLNHLPRTPGSVRFVLGLEFVGIVGLIVGCLTPFSAALVFVALTSLHQRNPFVLHSGDTLLRLLCLLLIFTPAGAMYSVDSWTAVARQAPGVASPWAVRLMQVLLTTVYLHSVNWKLRGKWWRDGTAVYWAMTARAYRRNELPDWLAHRVVYAGATYGTLAVEGGLALLIWISELRYPLLVAGVLFHLTLEYFMRIRLFQWTMLVGLLLFVRPDDLAALLRVLGAP
jgi:hypothetical protein